ncbi:GlxA family transcriptional regulator [Saccharospirillum salsuginis]|uniref:AraC family transcriptional regulator n=1 Tax=Saccharospirillum salsuginis TaxID=418750 RepID=A0A918K1R3_9GAMM|nr:helix-turn-helix domain-containing protein [Saccharospirillum salsuginis]GGX43249.1 AraC family transcriptional regulator [Saccharospirillum salsuginis]
MKIGLLVYPGCMAAGLLAFGDVLKAANARVGQRVFECQWVGVGSGAFDVATGVTVETRALSECRLHAVLVPGAWRDIASISQPSDDGMIRVLRGLPESTRLWAYCTGVGLLAETGRLAGQPATTTWWLLDWAANRFPDVRWTSDSTCLYRPSVATAAGVSGHQPLAMALIEETCGVAVRNSVQTHLMLPRPRVQPSVFRNLPGLVHESPFIRSVVHWVEATPAVQITTQALADALNLTPRTLMRRVERVSGYRCGYLMRLIKLKQVSDQLTLTGKTVSRISHELGYADDASLRRSFKQVLGITPQQYRQL